MITEHQSSDPAGVDLRGVLRHHDPSQLWYQLNEIVDDRVYLRHGIRLDPGDVVFDVGANVGVAAAFFATHGGAGVVHSFEPVRPLYELLRENVARFPACVPHPYGLGSRSGSYTITYYPGAAAMSGLHAEPEADRALVRTAMLNLGRTEAEADRELEGRYRPETLTCELRTMSEVMSELSPEPIDLLKIDVEKAELDVLEGIAEPDWRLIKQLAVEVHDERGRLAAIARRLEKLGFRVRAEQDPALRNTPVQMLYATRRTRRAGLATQ